MPSGAPQTPHTQILHWLPCFYSHSLLLPYSYYPPAAKINQFSSDLSSISDLIRSNFRFLRDFVYQDLMGLSSLPTPSEGVLTVLVVNTMMSIAILKQILSSVLRIIGIRSLPLSPAADPGSERRLPEPFREPSLTERFRSRFKAVRFGRRRADRHAAADCMVCLARFEPESVVNRLPCGHLFHKACVEKWLDYHHATCPLCRTHLLPSDEGAGSCPVF